MKSVLNAVAGYVLAVFAAALVITISVTPVASWGPSSNVNWTTAATDIAIFWISAASRIAVAAALPAALGILIAQVAGVRTTFFYCLWALVISLGLALASSRELSVESLFTLAIAGIVAGLAYRLINPQTRNT